jgi:hypothetical protein
MSETGKREGHPGWGAAFGWALTIGAPVAEVAIAMLVGAFAGSQVKKGR